ncbi:T9SS type A sorting domain-containing protein [Ulvibacter antarcticus]|uniref:Putative secreted protein (Por secretion system target) n=1 Tax=Ulvibacter antarcticus TaxID=442714 RepID=A0A3L9Y8U6_9FLAO|nr:T9SS type A sorting domain-containing protein [Ulvibacter antarcticus]RMA57116.1 putative secreted protein (Por secretion system target) [Ulvibacter antarcticus]
MKSAYCLLIFLVFSLSSQAQCPVGFYQIYYQEQLDLFSTSYPNCYDADAFSIEIGNVTDLSGLSQLNSLNYLKIQNTYALTSLVSLGGVLIKNAFVLEDNVGLTNIEGVEFDTSLRYILINDNPILEDLSPLSVITDISNSGGTGSIELNGPLNISSLDAISGIESANKITLFNLDISTLDELSNLTNVGDLSMAGNDNLVSIDGLSNVQSFERLDIHDNINLSNCAIQTVCDHIGGTQGPVFILNNAAGCVTIQEVADTCGVVLEIPSFELENSIVIYPNPASEILFISASEGIVVEKVTIYSLLGTEVLSTSEERFNISNLSEGIYFATIETNQGILSKKFVKE